MTNPIPDAMLREQALDPCHSFIVQAPAGSGKTELLTQRLLTLLTRVSQPEQVVAITFTRKAAGEMQDRVLCALHTAQSTPRPILPHAQKTYDLATQVLARDAEQAWQLLQSPHRLRILTFDALAAELAQTQPLEAGLGLSMQVTDDPEPLYQAALMALLTYLEQPKHPAYQHLKTLLLQLHNDAEKMFRLLLPLLEKRDVWLTQLMPYRGQSMALRAHLEDALTVLITDTLSALYDAIPTQWHQPLIAGLCFAANQLIIDNPNHLLSLWATYTAPHLPSPTVEFLPHYQALAALILTQDNQVRKTVDKRWGFPTTAKLEKTAWLVLLQNVSDLPLCLTHLIQTRLLPSPVYDDLTFQHIEALLELLPWITAELHLVFKAQHQIDFLEMSLAALRALGPTDTPSDLALQLDYQIQHLLIDEFQDTSLGQIELLERLTAGWSPGDGRTAFIVGDPMQSIYRFRNANVGLFLKAQAEGLGTVSLIPLTLCTNFRSNAALLEWINATFAPLFPQQEDMTLGAIPFSTATAIHPATIPAVHLVPHAQREESIQYLIDCIQRSSPHETIAILARTRDHFTPFVEALKKAQIAYHAVDLDALADCPEIRDASALVDVLTHPSDRIAWLTLLRSPLCGLSLNSLLILANTAQYHPFETAFDTVQLCDETQQRRLQHVHFALQLGLRALRLEPLCMVAEQTWHALGGLHTVQTAEQMQHLDDFWNLLYTIPLDAPTDTWKRRLIKLKARAHLTDTARVSLMTIHKSKGLEFDHVFLLELHRTPRSDTQPILLMNNTLIAPLPDEKSGTLYHVLLTQEQERLQLETTRLLYVAATRARHTLHCLFKGADLDSDPSGRSFLKLLSTVLPRSTWTLPAATSPILEKPVAIIPAQAWRLSEMALHTTLPTYPATEQRTHPLQNHALNFLERALGTLLHAALAEYAIEQKTSFTEQRILQEAQRLGIPRTERAALWKRFHHTLHTVLQDPRAQWILTPHPKHQAEYALSVIENEKPVHIILDRTFEADGVRWIIDYKNSHQPIATLYETYHTQLQRYATLWQQAHPQDNIRVGLYCLTTTEWIEWKETEYVD